MNFLVKKSTLENLYSQTMSNNSEKYLNSTDNNFYFIFQTVEDNPQEGSNRNSKKITQRKLGRKSKMLQSNHKKMDLELEFENNTETLKQEEINFISESKNGNLPFDMTGISCSNFKYKIYLESQ